MADQLISEITLECLMNKNQYAKYVGKTNTETKSSIKKDVKFYRRRIFDLTKKLLNNEKPETMYPDVGSAFDTYARVCIEYFKVLDKSDIIQEDYTGINVDNISSIPVDASYNTEAANMLMMRSIKLTEPNALEKLVKRTTSKLKKKQIVPLQKDINLKDPNLKNKGICKKNNININYEDISKKNKTNEKKTTGDAENAENPDKKDPEK
jgi:hypothetical protein